ncbi:MAG TPA: type I-E CRISPR-associated protein Cas5/CasD [Roseiflexaceae bacterium]|nr:type I-E CRISPR-associated protein Cas5/CasD [Roseiflexaceae bacterium]
MNTLFLRLEGPLQSWGLRSRWGERDTAQEPTKSGVLGLLGCALGLRRDDDRLRALSDELRMGVRVDLPGTLLRDYHTTGGGSYGRTDYTGGPRFHDQPYVGGVLSPEITRGRIKVKINASTKLPETDVSERMYLADASFLVALQGPEATIARLAEALQAPAWTLYLGRKSCPPAAPVFAGTGEHANLEAALASQPLPERARPPLRTLIETTPGDGARQNDAIGTPARRVFLPRFVRERLWWPASERPSINTFE